MSYMIDFEKDYPSLTSLAKKLKDWGCVHDSASSGKTVHHFHVAVRSEERLFPHPNLRKGMKMVLTVLRLLSSMKDWGCVHEMPELELDFWNPGKLVTSIELYPETVAMDPQTTGNTSTDALKYQLSSLAEQQKFAASNNVIKEKPVDFLQSFYDGAIAGAVAGVVVEAALYPIDTIKTRLQAAHGGGRIILKGLYSGLSGNLAGVLPASAIFLGVYEPIKQNLLQAFPEKFSALAHLSAGAIAGAASSIVRVPTEVVKQRMQTGHFATAPNAVRMIVSKEGFKGLYAGYGSFLLRDLPFDAIQFCIYEQIRIGYKLAAKRELNDPENALIGAFAGAITGAITTPLDVIKTRLMIQGSTQKYKGIYDCVRTIMREEGSHVFTKGMAPRVIWIGIGGSIFFGVLEKAKRVLSQENPSISNSD